MNSKNFLEQTIAVLKRSDLPESGFRLSQAEFALSLWTNIETGSRPKDRGELVDDSFQFLPLPDIIYLVQDKLVFVIGPLVFLNERPGVSELAYFDSPENLVYRSKFTLQEVRDLVSSKFNPTELHARLVIREKERTSEI